MRLGKEGLHARRFFEKGRRNSFTHLGQRLRGPVQTQGGEAKSEKRADW